MPSDDHEAPNDLELEDSIELVRHAQDGQQMAMGELFARYYPRVRALVRKRVRGDMRQAMESEDLLQEAMMDAIRGFQGFEVRSRQELIGWFARIVENNIHSAARHQHAQKRDRSREVSLQFVADYLEQSSANFQPASAQPRPDELAGAHEQGELLRESLEALDDDQRKVIELRNGQGATWSEVADAIGRPTVDAARMVYVRARIALQREFKRRGGAVVD